MHCSIKSHTVTIKIFCFFILHWSLIKKIIDDYENKQRQRKDHYNVKIQLENNRCSIFNTSKHQSTQAIINRSRRGITLALVIFLTAIPEAGAFALKVGLIASSESLLFALRTKLGRRTELITATRL